jgi:hypothetical protein
MVVDGLLSRSLLTSSSARFSVTRSRENLVKAAPGKAALHFDDVRFFMLSGS